MTARLLTEADLKPGTRIRYRSGRWGTVIRVKKPRSSRDWQVKVWDDSWTGLAAENDHGVWADRSYMLMIGAVVGADDDPNPTIHERWLHSAHR